MGIFCVEKVKDYTTISNYHLRDKELSLKAKGLLTMILALPEDWNFTIRGLSAICKEGVESIGTALKELEKGGFVVQSPIPGERRELSVMLTEAGRDYANEVLKPVYEAEERLFRLYFKDKDPEFVQELFRFSGVMHRYFTTGEFEETGSET